MRKEFMLDTVILILLNRQTDIRLGMDCLILFLSKK